MYKYSNSNNKKQPRANDSGLFNLYLYLSNLKIILQYRYLHGSKKFL